MVDFLSSHDPTPLAVADTHPQQRPTHRRSTIFTLAAGVSFLLYLHRYTWNLIRPELQEDYGLSNTALETLGAAFYLPYAAAQVPSGIICDLFGPHLFLVVIIILWSILLPLCGSTGRFGVLLGLRGGFGLAQAGAYPALNQTTRSWFARRHRTGVQGWIASAFGRCGGAMAPIVMGTLLMGWFALSWIDALIVLSAFGVLFAILFGFFYRNSPARDPRVNDAELAEILDDDQADESPRKVLPFRVALANRSFLCLLGQQFLVAGADVLFVLILGSYFDSLGVEKAGLLGLLISLPLWGGVLGGIAGGYINDWYIHRFSSRRWGRAAVAITGLSIGGILVLIAVTSSNPIGVALGLLAARFFTDSSQPTVWGACTDLGGQYSATVFGINNMVGNLGAFLLPFGVGPMLDYFSMFTVVDGETIRITNFVPAFLLCGAMKILAAGFWLFIDSSKPIVAGKFNSAQPHSDSSE